MKDLTLLAGRLFLSLIFVFGLIGKLTGFQRTSQALDSVGFFLPGTFGTIGAIVFLGVGSVLLILGLRVQLGAALLLVFLALATFYFHNPLKVSGDARIQETIQLLKNLGLAGGLLLVAASGAGRFSLGKTKSAPAP